MASEAQLAEFLADTTAFLVAPERAFGIIERPDDPRLDDWTVKMRKLGTITIYEPDRYAGHLVEFPSGCKDPHSGDDYYKQAKNLDYACVTGDEPDEPSPRPPSPPVPHRCPR